MISSPVSPGLRKGLSVNVFGFLFGQLFPSLDCGVHVASVHFNGVAAPAGAFRRQNCRTAAKVAIDHDVVALGAIEYGARNQREWLHRRVRFQLVFGAVTREAVGSWSIPDVGPVPAEATELNVVGMWFVSAVEDEDKLVAGLGERPQATVGFGPDAEQQVQTGGATGRKDLGHVAPIHEAIDQRAVAAVGADTLKRLKQETCEFPFGHVATSHRELAMACLRI